MPFFVKGSAFCRLCNSYCLQVLSFSLPEIRLSCMFGSSLILLKHMSVCERKANVAYHLVKVKKSPFFRLQSLFLRLRPNFFIFPNYVRIKHSEFVLLVSLPSWGRGREPGLVSWSGPGSSLRWAGQAAGWGHFLRIIYEV